MSSRLQISDELIHEADRVLERIEALTTSFSHEQLSACLVDVRNLANARTTGLSLWDGNTHRTLSGKTTDAIQQWADERNTIADAVHRIANSDSTSMLVAQSVGHDSQIVLENVFASAAECAELDDLMIAFADAFATVVQSQRVNQLESIVGAQQRLGSFIRSLHANRDPFQLANQIATDGATVLNVDRVSVIRHQANRTKVVAVTGVADVNDRANETRFLTSIASHCVTNPANDSWQTSDDVARTAKCIDVAPQPVRDVRILSTGDGTERATFVLERFDQQPANAKAFNEYQEQNEVLDHAGLALQNAWAFEDRGIGGFVRRGLRRVSSGNRLLFWPLAALITLAVACIPVDFEIECRGNLHPVRQQFVLAPSAGRIINAAENERAIEAGGVLLAIENTALELQSSQLQGERQTAKARLQTLKADRGIGGNSLISEAEVDAQILGLSQQLEILDTEIAALTVTAQFSGTVYLNDLTRELVGTSVQPGQQLMHLVDPNAGWKTRLQIPDKVIRHVVQADQQSDADLPVRIMLRTDPSVVFDGQLTAVGTAADIDVHNELSISGTVEFNVDNPEPLYPGAEVLAKIQCGKRALGFVLFREIIEFVQRRILF